MYGALTEECAVTEGGIDFKGAYEKMRAIGSEN